MSKLKRRLNPLFKNIPHLRGYTLTDMRELKDWEAYPRARKKYIFICTAKVASTSINEILNHYIHPEPRFHHMGIQDLSLY